MAMRRHKLSSNQRYRMAAMFKNLRNARLMRAGLTQSKTRGQILVLFALSLMVILGMAALALDVSVALNVKRGYQKIAAICAVVGAGSLPTDATAITSITAAAN